MNHTEYNSNPHRRLNPLTDEWVLVSPHRTQRPWCGEVNGPSKVEPLHYDAGCYLCPGNTRANGDKTPDYTATHVFTNDFSALIDTPQTLQSGGDPLLRAESERGICRVICYSPRHDLTMPRMSRQQVLTIIETWEKEYRQLGAENHISYVQIFENRGEMMGCSNPHPHGQIWANETIPTIPAKENTSQKHYLKSTGACLLCSYLETELQEQTRILFTNSSFAALVPFWAVWPFETMILPRKHHGSLSSLSPQEKDDLSAILIEVTTCYDNLFLTSFPYSMGIHQQPTDGRKHPAWHFHFHFYPPLLRSQSVKKHMVGYEMLAMPQRDITPEQAADQLRQLPAKHYLAGDER